MKTTLVRPLPEDVIETRVNTAREIVIEYARAQGIGDLNHPAVDWGLRGLRDAIARGTPPEQVCLQGVLRVKDLLMLEELDWRDVPEGEPESKR